MGLPGVQPKLYPGDIMGLPAYNPNYTPGPIIATRNYTPGNPEPIHSPAEPIFIEYSQRCFTAPSLVRSRRRGRNRSRRRSRGRQAPFAGAVCVRQLRFRHNCSFGALLYR